MTLLQELQLDAAILADIEAVAAGQPVNQSVKLGSGYLSATAIKIAGPSAQYPAFSGKFFSIFEQVFLDVAGISAGAPIYYAEKFGNTWYGISFQYSATPPPSPQ